MIYVVEYELVFRSELLSEAEEM